MRINGRNVKWWPSREPVPLRTLISLNEGASGRWYYLPCLVITNCCIYLRLWRYKFHLEWTPAEVPAWMRAIIVDAKLGKPMMSEEMVEVQRDRKQKDSA